MDCLLGLALMGLKRFREAAEQMRCCCQKRESPCLAPVNPEIRKAGPRHCLALCLEQLRRLEAAQEQYERALQDEPGSRPARRDYARFLAHQGSQIEALNLYFALAAEQPEDLQSWVEGAEIALSHPEFLQVALDWTEEAYRYAPENLKIVEQRATALTLAARCAEAIPLWQQARLKMASSRKSAPR